MKLVRVIPKTDITPDQIHSIEQFGFTLIFGFRFLSIWVEEPS